MTFLMYVPLRAIDRLHYIRTSWPCSWTGAPLLPRVSEGTL